MYARSVLLLGCVLWSSNATAERAAPSPQTTAAAEPAESDETDDIVTIEDEAEAQAEATKPEMRATDPRTHVARVVTPRKVAIATGGGVKLSVGDRVGFFAQKGSKAIGYGVIRKAATESSDAECEIELHERNQIIVEGDLVQRIDPRSRAENWPGRVDLEISGDKHVSAMYKRPAYYGPFVGEGHALEDNELLIDPLFKLEYGLTSHVSISTVPILDALKLPNLGIKVGVLNNDFVIATLGLKAIRAIDLKTNVLAPSLLVSFPTNTKMMSHIEVSVGFAVPKPATVMETEPPPDGMTTGQAQLSSSLTTPSLRSFSEYVFDNWDRIAGGPSYDFDLRAIGGFLSYMMVFDHLHLSFGVHTRNFTDFRLDLEKAYFPSFAIFWRL